MNAYNAYAGKNEASNRDLTDFFCYVRPFFDRHCIASTVFVPKHFANCTECADSAGLIYRSDLGRQMREDKQCPFSGETKGSGYTVQFGGRLPESEDVCRKERSGARKRGRMPESDVSAGK